MKIAKIGTFDKGGFPIYWYTEMDCRKEKGYALSIIDEKVLVNGVEIVEWTEERNKCMKEK